MLLVWCCAVLPLPSSMRDHRHGETIIRTREQVSVLSLKQVSHSGISINSRRYRCRRLLRSMPMLVRVSRSALK